MKTILGRTLEVAYKLVLLSGMVAMWFLIGAMWSFELSPMLFAVNVFMTGATGLLSLVVLVGFIFFWIKWEA